MILAYIKRDTNLLFQHENIRKENNRNNVLGFFYTFTISICILSQKKQMKEMNGFITLIAHLGSDVVAIYIFLIYFQRWSRTRESNTHKFLIIDFQLQYLNFKVNNIAGFAPTCNFSTSPATFKMRKDISSIDQRNDKKR